MDTKWKNNSLIAGLVPMILAAIIGVSTFFAIYPSAQASWSEAYDMQLESEDFISFLYLNNFILYKELYEKVNKSSVPYYDLLGYAAVTIDADMNEENEWEIQQQIQGFFQQYEYYMDYFSDVIDYNIVDLESNIHISNTIQDMQKYDSYLFYFSITYNEEGEIDSITVKSTNSRETWELASTIGQTQYQRLLMEDSSGITYSMENMLKGCMISYGISRENWEEAKSNRVLANSGLYFLSDPYTEYYIGYYIVDALNIILLVACAIIFLIPLGKKKCPWEHKFFRIPFELVVMILFFVWGIWDSNMGNLSDVFIENKITFWMGIPIGYAYLGFTIMIAMCFMGAAYAAVCLRAVRDYGVRKYIKDRSLSRRLYGWVKKKIRVLYQYMLSFDTTASLKKRIWILILLNAVAVIFLCCWWFIGIFGVAVYSILLYAIVVKYINNMKKKYNALLDAVTQISNGNLQVNITEDLGIFETFKPRLNSIQAGFRSAVEEETKSQMMKTELITNVSHDLKTPLTAIITYINLLKDETITPEQRKEYINTLERKSLRLKVLIEDLFEMSKAASKDVTIEKVEVDIVNLLKQVQLEFDENFIQANLNVRMTLPGQKVVLLLDSQKTYRIFENLMGNIVKYAMPHTRVYIDLLEEEKCVKVLLRNVSADEIGEMANSLTERFVRGDRSRNTEGSGLGLAIAKSFAQLQDGNLFVEADADLFKVTVVFQK